MCLFGDNRFLQIKEAIVKLRVMKIEEEKYRNTINMLMKAQKNMYPTLEK